MPVPLKLATTGGVVLVLVSVYPGVLLDVLFIGLLLSPLWLPVLGLGSLMLVLVQARLKRKMTTRPVPVSMLDDVGIDKALVPRRRWKFTSLAILALSFALIPTGIPRHAAFVLCRSAFQRHVATAPSSEHGGEALGRWLGVYYVDRYAEDTRGGVYFRTHSGPDGIGPDTTSYGFAFRPNPEGSPFGDAGYSLERMAGEWYCVSVSDDW